MLELAESEPWAGIAGWANAQRNAAWLAWLQRVAPGRRLLDVSAGAGVFAVAAARLGARHVIAFEPTELADGIDDLADRNGVGARVEVRRSLDVLGGDEVDVVYCAALATEPLADDVLRRLSRGAAWLAPGGVTAPRRLRLVAALVGPGPLTIEMAEARRELDRIGATWGLDLDPVRRALDAAAPYRWFTSSETPIGPAVEVWDVRPTERVSARTVTMTSDGSPAGGVVAWWEYELDDQTSLGGPPGTDATAPLVCSWPDAVERSAIRVRFSAPRGRVTATAIR